MEQSYYYPLFEHMDREHNLTLIDSEMDSIIWVVEKMLNSQESGSEKTPTNTSSPKFSCLFCGANSVSGLCEDHTNAVLDEQE